MELWRKPVVVLTTRACFGAAVISVCAAVDAVEMQWTTATSAIQVVRNGVFELDRSFILVSIIQTASWSVAFISSHSVGVARDAGATGSMANHGSPTLRGRGFPYAYRFAGCDAIFFMRPPAVSNDRASG